MKRKTKIVAGLAVVLMAFMTVFTVVQSFGDEGHMYLDIVAAREGNETYEITSVIFPDDPDKSSYPIWKIVSFSGMGTTEQARYDEPIYCVNPQIGFGGASATGGARKDYNYSFDMKNLTGLAQGYRDIIPNSTNYNSVLWILDNMYLPKDSNKAALKQSLYESAKAFGESKGKDYDVTRNVLTDNDIEVIQQIALWYFVSNNTLYHYEPENFPAVALNGTTMYKLLDESGMEFDTSRYEDMGKLYAYFIESAKANAAAYGTTDTRALRTPSVSYTTPADNSITSLEMIGGTEYFVAGPYNFNETTHTSLPYTISAEVLDQENTPLGSYKLLNSSKTELTGRNIDKSLLGQNFYIAVPTTNTAISKITLKIKTNYIATNATLWTHSTDYATEQPVVIPEKELHEVEISKDVMVKRPEFDLALRKFITKINGVAVEINRDPEVAPNSIDTTRLKNGTEPSTAVYTHPKNPLSVKVGDIVTYTIRVYNEGEKDGYAEEITDHLPEGLEFIFVPSGDTEASDEDKAASDFNIDNGWRYADVNDTKTIKTSHLSAEKDEDNLILKFNKETEELDYKEVQVMLKVIEPTNLNEPIVNIAEITDDADENGNEVEDRDSQPEGDGLVDLDNYELREDTSIYQQDDDDYEPVILEAPEFDLALRKYIVQVIGKDGNPKTISNARALDNIDKTPLSGTQTTADYKHRKDAVVVEAGDTVKYRLATYNEGEIDGYVYSIKDYLPQYLEFVPTDDFVKEGETSNTAKYAYTFDETTRLLTIFSNDDTLGGANRTSLWKLNAYDGTTLDSKYIEINCKISSSFAPQKNTYLTNVATMTYSNDDALVNPNLIEDRDSNGDTFTVPTQEQLVSEDEDAYTGNSANKKDLTDPEYHYKGQQDDDDFEKIVVIGLIPDEKEFDLALRKYIVQVIGKDGNPKTISNARALDNIDKTPLSGTQTTADYKHRKDAVVVEAGDTVKYRLATYNEGEIDGYVYSIKDYLPQYLEFVPTDDFVKEGETSNTAKYAYTFDETTRLLTIFSNDDTLGGANRTSLWKLNAYDGTTLDSKYIEINCKISSSFAPQKNTYLTNVATMTYSNDDALVNPNLIEDRDSNGDTFTVPTQEQLVSEDEDAYTGNSANKKDLTDPEYHYKGQQDDDDFEKIVVIGLIPDEKEFDLALRKFITQVNGEEITSRVPQVNADDLKEGSKTTATYTHPKDPVLVKTGDKVVYTIRIYNEGEVSGFAEEVTDDIPEGLKYIVDDPTNIEYMWELSDDGTRITTEYLSKANDENTDEDNLIPAFDKEEMTEPEHRDVKVVFEVTEPNDSARILTNIAEISDDADEDGNDVEDRDSEPDQDPENDEPDEDDIDEEHLKLIPDDKHFDLALRKFITKVNSQDVTTRIPVPSMGEDGKIKYNHPKDPVLVASSDIVIYTIRVYNEGTMAGYAKEVSDDIPAGLSYLPAHETNKKYEWILSEDGKTVSTDYLSKEKSDARQENNLLNAFDKAAKIVDGNPDYRDLQIAFKVTETNLAKDRIIINTAEITDDSDEDGNDVIDEDSEPDNNKPGEDDIDKEYLKVTYFDLSLLKWVSKAIVTENGKTTVTETKHTGLEKPEPTVKVDLDRKNINNVTVKFEYVIKITNEGEIEGYAKEISDYIPAGLKFVKEDNPDWEEKDGKIVTRKLENTLLKPGESSSVTVVLTWINDGENMGLKVNIAEISEDYNKHNSKDIDSTPNNKKNGEDDIDDAPVILTVRTGIEPSYVILTLLCLCILVTGTIFIKKYVLK